MNAIDSDKIYMRSLATRDTAPNCPRRCRSVGGMPGRRIRSDRRGNIGIGQGESAIVPLVDTSVYVMTPEFGAASQLEKIDMLDFADFVAINKFDRKGSEDALRDVRKQFQRNRKVRADHRFDAGLRRHGIAIPGRRRDRALSGLRARSGERLQSAAQPLRPQRR